MCVYSVSTVWFIRTPLKLLQAFTRLLIVSLNQHCSFNKIFVHSVLRVGVQCSLIQLLSVHQLRTHVFVAPAMYRQCSLYIYRIVANVQK